MNKGQLVDRIAKDAKITKGQASDALESVISGVAGALTKGGKVTLVGFGTFSVSSVLHVKAVIHKPEKRSTSRRRKLLSSRLAPSLLKR